MTPELGVCSWSLQPTDPADLAAKVRATGLTAVQLALDPIGQGLWSIDQTLEALSSADVTIRCGMMATRGEDYSTLDSIRRTGGLRPDEHWEENLAAAGAAAALARRLGLDRVTFHAGFLPHDRGAPLRRTMIDRLNRIADLFSARGVRIGLETGQETAETLLDVLTELDRPDVGVNFDPANMILYGMGDPIRALQALARYVVGIHIKDAVASPTPGCWGEEVPCGSGAVDWEAFFRTLRGPAMDCDLMIERESGADRVGDVRRAAALVRRFRPPGETGA